MCVCVFIKLHITAQSGPVILVILCHSHWSFHGVCVCVCVCVFIKLHIIAQSGPVMRFSPSVENEQADAGRDGLTRLARLNGGQGKHHFICSTDHKHD